MSAARLAAPVLGLALGCGGAADAPTLEQRRPSLPAESAGSEHGSRPAGATLPAPAPDPLHYVPDTARAVAGLDLQRLLPGAGQRRGFASGFASASPRLAAHIDALEACAGGVSALHAVTVATPAKLAPILVIRGEGLGKTERLRCYVDRPGIGWQLDATGRVLDVGWAQASGLVADEDTLLFAIDPGESDLLGMVGLEDGPGGAVLDRPWVRGLDAGLRHHAAWAWLEVDEEVAASLAGSPISSLDAMTCRGDLDESGPHAKLRLSCRLELSPAQATSLAAVLADPEGVVARALVDAGAPNDGIEATAHGGVVELRLDLPLAGLSHPPLEGARSDPAIAAPHAGSE